jgi:hypothetical protein
MSSLPPTSLTGIRTQSVTPLKEDLTLQQENDAGFPKLSAPARRALANAGYSRLDQLTEISPAELAKLHGMGPSAIVALRVALKSRGLAFRGDG